MMKKIIKLILVIIWMTFIFCLSNQEADDSSKLSDGFIDKTIIKTYSIYKPNVTEQEKINITEKYTHLVRKAAHFTLYLILGILVILYVKEHNIKKVLLLSLLICFLYACTDEFHQLFIKGRSAEITDVLIDSFGSFIGIKGYLLFNKIFISNKK